MQSNLRSPNVVALLNGSLLPGVFDIDVTNNAHFGAARFRLQVAMNASTASQLVQPGGSVDIQVSLGGPLISVVQGEVDSMAIDVVHGVVSLEGRDFAGRLIDARTEETFSNQTSSEIAETLASRHNLAPNVTPTTALAGRYYRNEHERITLGQFSRSTTEWDLLTYLAAREGFEVYVTGTTLNFTPLASSSDVFYLTPQACIALSLEHALTLARDIEVTVKSWNTRQQTAFAQTARSSAASTTAATPRKITVVRPNLSPNDALQLAQRILTDLSAHERVVSVEMPGEISLSPRSQIVLNGTGTEFDQTYYISELTRHFSTAHGFTETLRLKNMPQSSGTTPISDAPTP